MRVQLAMVVCASLGAISPAGMACEQGDKAYDAGDFEVAIAAYTACIAQSDSPSPDWNHRRGRSHMKQGDYDSALSDFGAALESDPNHAASLNSRAWVYYLKGNTAGALDDINAAIALDPDNPRFLDSHAHILAASGSTENAIRAFDSGMRQQSREGVTKIQRKLADLGLDPGPIDGVYGPLTRAALERCARNRCNIWQQ